MVSFGNRPRLPRAKSAVPLTLLILSYGPAAAAEVTWQGDFETGDTSQFTSVNNASGISVEDANVLEGSYAGKITITDAAEHIWSNGLNRVEVQHRPSDALTQEGSDFAFGFSFMLPVLLTEDDHQICYFESFDTWQQVMSFHVKGSALTFTTNQPSYTEHYSSPDAIHAGKWHDLALSVHWSEDAAQGSVDVWLDGTQIVSGALAKTLADSNPHFTQFGILRDTISTAETIYLDNARSGTNIEDVLALATSATGGNGGGGPSVGSGGGGPSVGSGGGANAAGGAGATGGATGETAPSGGGTIATNAGGATPDGGAAAGGSAVVGGAAATGGQAAIGGGQSAPPLQGGGCHISPVSGSTGGALASTFTGVLLWLRRRKDARVGSRRRQTNHPDDLTATGASAR